MFGLIFTPRFLILTGEADPGVEYTNVCQVVQIVVTNVVSNAASGIPFIGSFARISFLKSKACEDFLKDSMREEAIEKVEFTATYGRQDTDYGKDGQIEMLKVYGMTLINRRIMEVAVELSRMFEYHICMAKSTVHVQLMAIHAAKKILENASNSSGLKFEITDMVEALFMAEDESIPKKLLLSGS